LKYINSILKVNFEQDIMSKPKPVAGPDDMFLIFVQYWARDKSIFLTEDDHYDIAIVILFQAYTSGRPAEFVHSSKGKTSEDPLGEREETNKNSHPRKVHCDADDEPEYDGDSDASNGLGFDDNVLFDFDDDRNNNNNSANKTMDEHGCPDSGYNNDGTDITMTENTDKYYTTEIDESRKPLRQNSDAAEPSEFEEAKQKYKTFCYKDICFWII
jgi:hypothetical protein